MPPKPKKEPSLLDQSSAIVLSNRFLWPEWSDVDINSEKWDGGAKKVEKGKSATPISFEDTDGQPTLPESLASLCTEWKRIRDIFVDVGGTLMFEESTQNKPLSILHSNNHLLSSPFIRTLIGSIRSYQDFCLETEGLEDWRPWNLIYSMNKTGGKEHRPLLNPSGKYIVKLYWVGKWRKIIVDDYIPCNENGASLLLTSSNNNEIWPLILSKALLKLSSMAFSTRNKELPEFHIITALTGWIPEVLTGSCNSTWKLLNQYLPLFTPENAGNQSQDDSKLSKDKKDKKKKDENPTRNKMMAFCLAELEHGEADLHPCQIIKIRDRPLKPPPPPPVIPRWKLIRPMPDVIEQLEEMERSKIPDRWCYIRSALKVSGAEEEDENSQTEADCEKNIKSKNECDWMRIEDIWSLENSRIFLFHRVKNPDYKVIQLNHISNTESIIPNKLHNQFFFAEMETDDQDIIVSFQVQNRKTDWNYQQSIKCSKTKSEMVNENSQDADVETPEILSSTQLLEADIASSISSTLRIQNYSLKKYFQTPVDIIRNESYSQGSVRFTLPKGRTVLRFQLSAEYASTMSVLFEVQNKDNIHFAPLDQIMPYAANFPSSWLKYGKELLDAVLENINSLGERENLQIAIRKLASLTENDKENWLCFRRAFYKLANEVLGENAIPEDLGALRLAFRDYVPSVGPQKYFPNVKTGLNTESVDISDLEKAGLDNTMVSVEALTAASLIARNWRGFAVRKNYDALTGNSPGAQRRQESAKKRFEELYQKFDENTPEALIRLYFEEMDNPDKLAKVLAADAAHTFSMSTLEGKIGSISGGWNLLFREQINLNYAAEIFPLFTEFGREKSLKTRIRLLDQNGAEIGQVLRRVLPVFLQPGKYTLVGEAEGPDSAEGQLNTTWKLQLISSPIVKDIIKAKENPTFTIQTESGPYLPPDKTSYEPGLLFRYTIGVTSALPASFHLSANNPNAELKLILKESGNVVYSCGGEQSILIPSWDFRPGANLTSASSSSVFKEASRSGSRVGKGKKDGKTGREIEGKYNTTSNGSLNDLLERQYVLEGHCVGNWNLTEVEEAAVVKLRQQNIEEMRVFEKSNSEHSDIGSIAHKKTGRSMSKIPTPEATEQAGWTLRIFLDSETAENIELKIDSRRKEKIRAMKLAWEAAEEGRQKKGYEARKAYLDSLSGEPVNVETLLASTRRGSIGEEPEVAIEKFRQARANAEKYRKEEEEKRNADLENTAKQYQLLAEREKTVFEQIQHSLRATGAQTPNSVT